MILLNSAFWYVVMFIRIPMVLVSKLDSFTNIVDLGLFFGFLKVKCRGISIGYLQGSDVE